MLTIDAGPTGNDGRDPQRETAEREKALVAALRAGDPAAFETLVRDHAGRMLATARRFVRGEHDAADAVQEAFLSAFQAIDRFQGEAKLGTWLHRIVVNACLMKIRASSRRPEISIESLLPAFNRSGHHNATISRWHGPSDGAVLSEELRALVRQSIDMLPEDHRSVLLLRDIEELSTEETAVVLGINAGAVKTRLHRARQALRTLLDPHLTR